MLKNLLVSFMCCVIRMGLSLRYRIEIRGKEQLDLMKKKKGVLFLPNHPAHLDPIFLILQVWKNFKVRPLVIEYVFRQPFINRIMKILRALPIPNFESSINQLKMEKGKEVLDQIGKGLKKGENFVVYPAGKLKKQAAEVIGGASAAKRIVDDCPGVQVVLVRTTGLWGSRFSRALIGKSPDIKKNIFQGVKILLKNLIFFTPRRKVVIEFEVEPKGLPKMDSRIEFNRFLENWYNQYPSEIGTTVTSEPLTLIPYHPFSKKVPKVLAAEKGKKEESDHKVTSKTQQEVFVYLAELSQRSPDDVDQEMNLALDLGLDSLDIAQVVGFLCDHYDVKQVHPEDIESVKDVLHIASGKQVEEKEEEEESPFLRWPKEEKRKGPALPSGKTIIEAFFYSCDRMKNSIACGDDMIGVLTYSKLKLSIIGLSAQIKKMPGKHIGVLLPASNAAYIVILAIIAAKKVPVMLNWTLGPRYLNDMMQLTKAKSVISSWKFLEKLTYVEFGDLTEKIVLLENIKKKITSADKIKALYKSKKSTPGLIKSLGLKDLSEDDPAVVLFTSGTESSPKGVPLSHKNILENQRAAFGCIKLVAKDTFFGILPPFHSFGFSVAGLFPLLIGIKVAYYPDPTDSFALVKGIVKWKISIFCSAPSFLKGLLKAGSEKELKSIRLFVSGAEKAPQEILTKIKKFAGNKEFIEGYGITECAPILSLNRPGEKQIGVGKLLPGIDSRVIHPETLTILAGEADGEICVRGPNVFTGYLGDVKPPFIELEGKTYYRTGDLGHIDKEGNVILSGRKKRFTKIGGEMISLAALEEAIANALMEKNKISGEETSIAICAAEKEESKSFLVLFSTIELDRKEVNLLLKAAGFSRLVKIAHVKIIKEIPVLGTGKVDFRKLQSLVDTIE